MKIEEQVCSLELANRLKELGVKQESYFYYVRTNNLSEEYSIVTVSGVNFDMRYLISAFTVAELGEMLPWKIRIKEKDFHIAMDVDKHIYYVDKHIYYQEWHLNDEMYCELDDTETEADARAKLLIYLIENGLMPK